MRKIRTGKTKLKTHKATSKRFRLTGSGVLVRTKGGKSHLRRRTSKRTKALLPLQNNGELAVLYCFVFLFIAAQGGGIWSADSLMDGGSGKAPER